MPGISRDRAPSTQNILASLGAIAHKQNSAQENCGLLHGLSVNLLAQMLGSIEITEVSKRALFSRGKSSKLLQNLQTVLAYLCNPTLSDIDLPSSRFQFAKSTA